MLTRRSVLLGTAATGLLAGRRTATAQGTTVGGWPARAVRVIVPSGAGGPAENFRMFADHFQSVFGQSFVLENQPGAAGAIGSMNVARAAPDGYTLLCAANSHLVLAPLVTARPAFDVRKDFAPIGLLITYPFCMIVNAELPVRTLQELAAYGKANPGKLNHGSIGIGTGGHLVAELFKKRAGIEAVHIPYTGAPAQVMGVASGALQFTVDTIGNARGAVEAGKVRYVAVTGSKRAAAAPDVPTFAESGFPGFDMFLWLGLLAPPRTPAPILEAINREINACNQKPDVRARLEQGAYEPAGGSAQDFLKLIDEEFQRWSAIVDETGARMRG